MLPLNAMTPCPLTGHRKYVEEKFARKVPSMRVLSHQL